MSDRGEPTSERESERIGVVVADRYTLIKRLGRGGMGSVWSATDATKGTQVALKFIDTKRHGDPDVLSRFEREARTIAGIDSRHVVKVLGHGLDPMTGPYIALELLEGEDLGKRLDRESTLPVRDVVQVIVQACRGLWEAHQAGIIHRDIKPENLFLEELRGRMFVKIVDFGVAKVDDGGRALTAPGELLGTLEYMSPEHVMAKGALDARADLYSLAVVAYRSLVGRPPFLSDQIGELILQLMTERHAPPSTLRSEVPREFDRWFDRALGREPADRFQTAHEMAEALVAAFRASTAKVENFDAPLSLSPSSVAKMGSAASVPPPSLELADLPRGDSRRPRHGASEPVATPSIRPAPASMRPHPASRSPAVGKSVAPDANLTTGRVATLAPLPEVRPATTWAGTEGKMVALVALVMVGASVVFYLLAS